ncbi:MAG: FHA domain-containing protein [Phycisphaerae bacterium]|nr:FHA domain-containing protein [Phycisphaerae bacterium]
MDAKLIYFREDGSRRDVPLLFGRTMVGRKKDCGVRIPLASVSRHHAEIVLGEKGVLLRDLGSANGTFVNNRRVLGDESLEPGDQILIGGVVFTLQMDGTPADEDIAATPSVGPQKSGAKLATSRHVYISDEDVDPISALEALASSADQTAIDQEPEVP